MEKDKYTDVRRLDEKRFLSIEEFAMYTSLGKNNARILAERCRVELRIKSRVLVDRYKFDRIETEEIEQIMN